MKQKIFIDVPCPVSLRNVISGEHSVYRRLTRAGYDVVLLTPEFAAQKLRDSFGATVEGVLPVGKPTKFELASDFVTKHLNLTRMQILGSKYGLRHNLNKRTIHSFMHILRVVVAHTLGKLGFFRLQVAPRLHLLAYRRRPLKVVFEKHKPALVFVPNMASVYGEETLRECKRQGVPTIGMVGSWDHPHKRFQALQTDQVFVWSESIKQEMIELQSYPPERVVIAGAPHTDFFTRPEYIMSEEEFFTMTGLDPKRKLFTFFSGTGRAPDEGDVVDMLLRASEAGKTTEPVQAFVRTYPGDPQDHKKFDLFTGRKHIYIDWHLGGKEFGAIPINYFPDEAYMRKVVSLFHYSAAILSVYSSASVEASIFKKPSINIAFDGYKERPFGESIKRFTLQSHFDKLFSTGAVIDTHSEQELIAAVNTVIEGTHGKEMNIDRLREAVCGTVDGKASERIAARIAARLEASVV